MLDVAGSNLTIFKLEPTTPNILQHIATRLPNVCNMLRQQCCAMLRWHVVIVWLGLQTILQFVLYLGIHFS